MMLKDPIDHMHVVEDASLPQRSSKDPSLWMVS